MFKRSDLPDYTVKVSLEGDYRYVGKASPGASETSLVWQIIRVTESTGTTLFASGDNNFDKAWSLRTTYTFS